MQDCCGVDYVLAGGAQMDEVGGVFIFFDDEGFQLFYHRDCEISGERGVLGKFLFVEKICVTFSRDDLGSGRGDYSCVDTGAREGGFEVQHALEHSVVGEEFGDGGVAEELVVEIHGRLLAINPITLLDRVCRLLRSKFLWGVTNAGEQA